MEHTQTGIHKDDKDSIAPSFSFETIPRDETEFNGDSTAETTAFLSWFVGEYIESTTFYFSREKLLSTRRNGIKNFYWQRNESPPLKYLYLYWTWQQRLIKIQHSWANVHSVHNEPCTDSRISRHADTRDLVKREIDLSISRLAR